MRDTGVDTEAVGRRLAGLRAVAGLTQEEAAAKAGLAPLTVSRAENGRFAIVSLVKLREVYNASLDYIVYGKGG